MGTFHVQLQNGQMVDIPENDARVQQLDPNQVTYWRKNYIRPEQEVTQGGLDITGKQLSNVRASTEVAASQTPPDVVKYFESHAGSDHYVSPQDYLDQKKKWIGAVGGANPTSDVAKTFDQNFRDWRNPNNPNYSVDPASLTSLEQKNLDMKQKADAAGNQLNSTLDDVLTRYDKLSEFQKRIPLNLASTMPILSPGLAEINAEFYSSIEPQLRSSIVGGRITQQEIQWLKNAYLPTQSDTTQTYSDRIQVLKDEITRKQKDNSYIIGSKQARQIPEFGGGNVGDISTSGDWEVVSQ